MRELGDVIYAPTTARAPAALAGFRVSGVGAHTILQRLTEAPAPVPRRASLRRLRRPADGVVIDEALVIAFSEGASYTGEECVELFVHGGLAVMDAVCLALEGLGARLAEPGEFTRRAVLAGRLDLAQAESVAALAAAETEQERRRAVIGLDGAVGRAAAAWRAEIVEALALMESGIDFVDEALGESLEARALAKLEEVSAAAHREMALARIGGPARARPTLALIGPPNAGKSTLINALLGRDVAIVAAEAGTTRDPVPALLRVGGREIEIVDTAGVRDAHGDVEATGVERALARAHAADGRLIVVSDDTWPMLSDGRRETLRALIGARDEVLFNKADIGCDHFAEVADWADKPIHLGKASDDSAREVALGFARQLAEAPEADNQESVLVATDRRAAAVGRFADGLDAAVLALQRGHVEIAAAATREALPHLSSLVDPLGDDEVLDQLFKSFCVGK